MSASAVVKFLYQLGAHKAWWMCSNEGACARQQPTGTPPLTKKYYCACHVTLKDAQPCHLFMCGQPLTDDGSIP
jgi:hypothetical protein